MTVTTDQDTENKAIITAAMTRMAAGDGGAFVDAFAENVTWRQMGSGHLAKAYEGKAAVLGELFRPLMRQYADRYANRPVNIFADGDHVIVEARGKVTTRSGLPYNNRYCMIFQMEGGKVREVREYMDTALANVCLDFTVL